MSQLILASKSEARQRLLRAAGVAFEVRPAAVDELAIVESLVSEKVVPRNVADALAEIKALQISRKYLNQWVIGADQTLSLEGQLFQKPETKENAKHQLMMLRGKTHSLHSAVCVAHEGSVIWREVAEARLVMRDFSDAFLDTYLVDAGEDILWSVGGYHVEGLGLQLFSRIEGDFFTIQGLPMIPLLNFLRLHGLLKQ